MALLRISDLTAATTPLAGTEMVELETVANLSRRATAAEIAAVPNTASVLTPAAGVVTINCALGDYFTLAPTANVTSILFSNLPGSGKAATKMIRFTQDTTARTVAWPASFKWAGGAAGSVSTGSGAFDVLALTTFDNGVTWFATLAKAFA